MVTKYISDLVLIPGLNNTGEVWDGVVNCLPPTITCHTPNCPALPNVEDIAEALLKQLPDRFHLCGFSFGGYVALSMLEKAPERISGFSLLCSLPYEDSQIQKDKRKAAIDLAQSGKHLEMVLSQGHLVFHADNQNNPDLDALRKKIVTDYGSDRFIAHQQACINRPDRTNLLESLHIPLLILGGDQDIVVPTEELRKLSNRIKRAEFGLINKAGHMAPLENPKEIANKMLSWLQEFS
ncbi:alpha/beta fold hydrolase [Bacillus sp. FJAT-29814]|uniref:alpha/beta fold hydrolase n=1 Tax=Bacillus sp. FJAT-29814 TaxID=1729688 RepID=UPI00082EA724|nr:alpha/beta hydrolase [Bacillus sp. FJAT-29814]